MVFECPICYRHRRKIITLQCRHQVCFFLLAKVVEKRTSLLQKKMAYLSLLSRTSGTILLGKTFPDIHGRDVFVSAMGLSIA